MHQIHVSHERSICFCTPLSDRTMVGYPYLSGHGHSVLITAHLLANEHNSKQLMRITQASVNKCIRLAKHLTYNWRCCMRNHDCSVLFTWCAPYSLVFISMVFVCCSLCYLFVVLPVNHFIICHFFVVPPLMANLALFIPCINKENKWKQIHQYNWNLANTSVLGFCMSPDMNAQRFIVLTLSLFLTF